MILVMVFCGKRCIMLWNSSFRRGSETFPKMVDAGRRGRVSVTPLQLQERYRKFLKELSFGRDESSTEIGCVPPKVRKEIHDPLLLNDYLYCSPIKRDQHELDVSTLVNCNSIQSLGSARQKSSPSVALTNSSVSGPALAQFLSRKFHHRLYEPPNATYTVRWGQHAPGGSAPALHPTENSSTSAFRDINSLRTSSWNTLRTCDTRQRSLDWDNYQPALGQYILNTEQRKMWNIALRNTEHWV